MKHYAHKNKSENNQVYYHDLLDHIQSVAESASLFAGEFRADDWGYCAGLWHDLGKYSEDFQRRLSGEEIHVDHSTAGAQHAHQSFPKGPGKILAYAISGHHGGLLDGKSNTAASLNTRLEKTDVPIVSEVSGSVLNPQRTLELPKNIARNISPYRLSVFIRMLFSCLVDADYLDTERFFDPENAQLRKKYPQLKVLQERLNKALDDLSRTAFDNPINQQRNAVLKNCKEAADWQPGLFSLTVPTGGGKTLSSLAFALKHALKYGMRRIIYVIPFTSIIEQNADVFRKAVGDDAVVEHHSAFEPEKDDQSDNSGLYKRHKLATENWDAPIIVTTSVQFFESFYHNKPSRCRKLHNTSRSVIILDEAQTMPVPLLKPCIEILRELASTYASTVVLCTATQPVLTKTIAG